MIRKRAFGNGSAIPRVAERTHGAQAPEMCQCAGSGLPPLDEICAHPTDRNAIVLLRFVFAAHAFHNVQCIDAALGLAAELYGYEAAPLVAGRLLTLVRSLRLERHGNFRFLPGNCTRISEDEMELAEALRAARLHEQAAFQMAQALVARTTAAPTVGRSIWLLAATLECAADVPGPQVDAAHRPLAPHLH